jgi:2-(3-amino-3-carboxypropyl)histidine synthase
MLKTDLTRAIAELKKLKAKRIFLQIPEGLKTKVDSIIEELEGDREQKGSDKNKKGFEVVASMDPCFGACDVKTEEAKRLGCDAILHLGHNAFVPVAEQKKRNEKKLNKENQKIPIIYAPLEYELESELDEAIKKLVYYLRKNKIKSIGLVTTIQFFSILPKIKSQLKKNGFASAAGKGKRVEDGQVLGCNYSSANVPNAKAIVFFGDGLFHPLGISFSTKKEVIVANPFTREIKSLGEEKDKFLRKRILMIEKAKEAKVFGILVSTKLGQNRIEEAEQIKRELEKAGKKARIFVMNYISSEKLLGADAQALINTACPRIAFDDYASFKQPIISKSEVKYLLGKKKYDDYEIEEVY